MELEVALLEWNKGEQGVRLLGRSSDPGLVEAVRDHLVDQLGDCRPESASLRLIRPKASRQPEREGPEDDM